MDRGFALGLLVFAFALAGAPEAWALNYPTCFLYPTRLGINVNAAQLTACDITNKNHACRFRTGQGPGNSDSMVSQNDSSRELSGLKDVAGFYLPNMVQYGRNNALLHIRPQVSKLAWTHVTEGTAVNQINAVITHVPPSPTFGGATFTANQASASIHNVVKATCESVTGTVGGNFGAPIAESPSVPSTSYYCIRWNIKVNRDFLYWGGRKGFTDSQKYALYQRVHGYIMLLMAGIGTDTVAGSGNYNSPTITAAAPGLNLPRSLRILLQASAPSDMYTPLQSTATGCNL